MSNFSRQIVAASVLSLLTFACLADVKFNRASVDKARMYRLEGKPRDSAKLLEQVVSEDPGDYRASYNLGLAYEASGQIDLAIAEMEKAKALKERQGINDPTIYNSLGYVYLLARNYESANRNFEIAESPENFSQLSPRSRRALLNNRGLLAEYSGDKAQAREFYVRSGAITGPTQVAVCGRQTTVVADSQTGFVARASGASTAQSTWGFTCDPFDIRTAKADEASGAELVDVIRCISPRMIADNITPVCKRMDQVFASRYSPKVCESRIVAIRCSKVVGVQRKEKGVWVRGGDPAIPATDTAQVCGVPFEKVEVCGT